MNNINIRKAKCKDILKISKFFDLTLSDTFQKNNYEQFNDLLDEEMQEKKQNWNDKLKTGKNNNCLFIAENKNEIIGTIEYALVSKLILDCTHNELKDFYEVKTIFVHPKYQNQGIGSLLLKNIVEEFKDNKISEFCLDSGYIIAQKIWTRKFGKPNYHIRDYWSKGIDHMIWKIKI